MRFQVDVTVRAVAASGEVRLHGLSRVVEVSAEEHAANPSAVYQVGYYAGVTVGTELSRAYPSIADADRVNGQPQA